MKRPSPNVTLCNSAREFLAWTERQLSEAPDSVTYRNARDVARHRYEFLSADVARRCALWFEAQP